MLKNSKGIKFFSVLCYLIGLTALGFFIYEMVTLKGEYEKNLGLIIGLGVGAVMFLNCKFRVDLWNDQAEV